MEVIRMTYIEYLLLIINFLVEENKRKTEVIKELTQK